MFPAATDLHGEVAVALASLVRDDLHPVELHDGARVAAAGLGVVDSRHTLLNTEGARTGWEGVGFSIESCCSGGFEEG